jgi:hypothetical protein
MQLVVLVGLPAAQSIASLCTAERLAAARCRTGVP